MTAPANPSAEAAANLVDRSLETATILDKGGYSYLVHPLLDGVPRAPPALLQAWVDWARSQTDLVSRATVLLAPEAMGLPLVAALSLATGLPYLVVRKRKYGLPGEIVAHGKTGYSSSDLHLNGLTNSDRVLLVDDVLSTGATLAALLGALASLKIRVVGVAVFVDKGAARPQLQALAGAPIRAMRSIVIESGKVRIVH